MRPLLWGSLIAFGCLLGPLDSATAASDVPTIDLSKVDKKLTIDVRKDMAESVWRMLVFMARDANPEQNSRTGHAYIAALEWRPDIQGFVTLSVFGAFPYAGDNSKGVLDYIDGDGSVGLDPLDQFPEAALLVNVDTAQLADAVAIRDRWKKEAEWSILNKDCVTMFQDVARKVGLKLPDREFSKPYEYLLKVMETNS